MEGMGGMGGGGMRPSGGSFSVEGSGRTVSTSPFPGIRVPMAPEGAFTGLQKTGDAALNLYNEQVKMVNEAVTLDASTKLEMGNSDIALQAAQQFKGKDAVAGLDWGLKEFDKRAVEISNGLTEVQKMSVMDRAAQYRADLYKTLSAYSVKEAEKFSAESNKNFWDMKGNNIALGYADPGAFKRNSDELRASINDYYMGNTAAAQAEYQGRLDQASEEGIIGLLAKGQDMLALQRYEETKGLISSAAIRTKIEEKLKIASTNGEADRISQDTLARLTPEDPLKPMNVFDVVKDIRSKTSDPHVFKAAETMAHEYVNNWNERQKELYEANKSDVYKDAAKDVPFTIIKNKPSYLALNGGDQEAFKEKMRARAEHAADRAKKTDEETKLAQTQRWGELISNPDLLRNTDLNVELVARKIDKTQYQNLTMAKEKQDPLKSNEAKNAIANIDKAAAQRLFNPDDSAANIAEWNRAKGLIQTYIQNNWDKPDYDPAGYANKLIEPVQESWSQWLLDKVSEGQPGLESATKDKYDTLSKEAGVVKAPVQNKATYQTGWVYTNAQGRKAKYLGDDEWQLVK